MFQTNSRVGLVVEYNPATSLRFFPSGEELERGAVETRVRFPDATTI